MFVRVALALTLALTPALSAESRLDGVPKGSWRVSRLSGSGSFSGGLVFVGYGIDAPSVGYDDFAGLELRGKVALIFLGEPQEADADSPFDGLIPSRWSHPRAKAEAAAQRGAAAVVFVGNAEAKAIAPEPEGPAMQPIAIPVLEVEPTIARSWMKGADIDAATFRRSVDADLAPRSRPIPGVTVSGRIEAGKPSASPAAPGVDPFYASRPGPDFVIRAGKPFEKRFEGEAHLDDIRQLTFGGENAEAYFSPDGTKLIYQWTRPEGGCDQQYVLDLATGETKLVSTGKGRTTCGYYDWPEGDRIVYASTESGGDACPPAPDMSKGYVWALYDTYDLWAADPDGSNARRITDVKGYDAEATWCHRGGKLIFTSVRDGDLELYVMDEAGATTRITREPGYDGGAFFSPDCTEITWRAGRPKGADLDEYRALLAEGLIRPRNTEIYVANADGSNPKRLTDNGAANFCPYFTADGRKIIYTSNFQGGRQEFELYLIDKTGGTPERITYSPGFDGFPVFSPDGRWLVWASNRAALETRETNLFIARWK